MANTGDFTINKCIYCGGPGETNEHMLPYALGGRILLRKASCEKCREITSKCECNQLKEIWAETRAVLDYPSRNRIFTDELFPLSVVLKDGTETILQLRKSEALGLTPFLEYSLPVFFAKCEYIKGINVIGQFLIGFGPGYKSLIEKYGIKQIKYTTTYKGNDFEKMVVNVAYRAAVASCGIDSFEHRYVLQTILGKKDDIGFWMGCDPEGTITPLIGKHNISNIVRTDIWQKANDGDKTRYVVARIKFFAASDAPEYIVIVGTLKPNAKISPIRIINSKKMAS